jgi:hypothetical protein
MKKYALLYFQQLNDTFSKWMFPLHDGENIIGSDKGNDIFLYLNEKEDIIDEVHCKIIVNEMQNDVGIISLASKGYVKRGEDKEKITLSPGKEYELNHKSVFYLTDSVKFMLIKGTVEEIHNFFLEENLEDEFNKWYQLILENEKMKTELNLTRKESNNKSFVSNNNENNNNVNYSTPVNNHINNNIILNKELANNNTAVSLLGSINKEVNRIGFNNFDEVPDNLISDYKNSHNPINSAYKKNNVNSKNSLIISPYKKIENEESKKESNNSYNNSNNNNSANYIKQISTEKISNIIMNEKETEINSIKSELKDEFNFNNKYSKEPDDSINYNRQKENYDNSLNLFRQASSNSEHKRKYSEKEINKDEKTMQTIRELLGENNLEIIIKNTNNKEIKKFDVFFKNSKNKLSGVGNIDIQVKKNDFLNKTIKYEHRSKIKDVKV